MDDINRPVGRPQPFGAPNPGVTAAQPLRFTPGNPLDEARLEREFGQPADGTPLGLLPDTAPKRTPFAIVGFGRGRTSRKHLIILGAVGLAIVIAASAGAFTILHRYKPVVTAAALPTKKYTPPPKPTIVPSTLTGLPVDPGVNGRPVTGVMIENSIDARPQSGLDQAGVVFEAIAEGGITRFLALFQDSQPDYIGPVRSARYYYIEWLLGFDAAYAHVGGSPEALQDITDWHVKDLNQFYNAGAYDRISSRYAPHNVYTSIAQLNALESGKGFTSKYTGFARKDKETPSKTPDATSINMAFSGYYYDTHYDYDAATNTYKRSQGGAAHTELHKDGSTAQIAPKVLVALVVPYSLEPDGYHSSYTTAGSGKLLVFQDGTVTAGTWTKTSREAQFSFADAQGQPLKLDPGQTWISALKSAGDVTYK